MWNVVFIVVAVQSKWLFPFCPSLLGLQKQPPSLSFSARHRQSVADPSPTGPPFLPSMGHCLLTLCICTTSCRLMPPFALPWMTSSRPSRSPPTPRSSSPPPQSRVEALAFYSRAHDESPPSSLLRLCLSDLPSSPHVQVHFWCLQSLHDALLHQSTAASHFSWTPLSTSYYSLSYSSLRMWMRSPTSSGAALALTRWSGSTRTGQASICMINLNLKPCAGHGHGLKWLQYETCAKFESGTKLQYWVLLKHDPDLHLKQGSNLSPAETRCHFECCSHECWNKFNSQGSTDQN
jgi:hypothetical protein